jgi:hypothetical protein
MEELIKRITEYRTQCKNHPGCVDFYFHRVIETYKTDDFEMDAAAKKNKRIL